MKYYLVHFTDYTPAFACFASDIEHAKEQAENAYPDSVVNSIFECSLVWHLERVDNIIVNIP